MNIEKSGFNTQLIHAGEIDDQYGSATVPIYQTSTFSFESVEEGAKCFSGESDGYFIPALVTRQLMHWNAR